MSKCLKCGKNIEDLCEVCVAVSIGMKYIEPKQLEEKTPPAVILPIRTVQKKT